MDIVHLLIDAAAIAAAYALAAIGFVLVLNATGAVNFSHGDLVMAGGLAASVLASRLDLPGLVVLPLVATLIAAVGVAVAAFAYLPLRRQPPDTVFVGTIAAGVILQNLCLLIFGPEPRAAPALLGTGAVQLGGVDLDRQKLATIACAAVLIVALHRLLYRTRIGRQLRATAEDGPTASLLGIRTLPLIVATFAAAAALAGTAGLMLANSFFVTPSDGANYILKSYIAVVIGGWGSLPGALAGAAIIAAFEVVYPSLPVLIPAFGGARAMFSQTAANIALDLAILLLLMVRPQGLFGERAHIRS